MRRSATAIRAYRGPAILSYGFRPFFLRGAIAAALVPVVTLAALAGFIPLQDALSNLRHELIFGYVSAAVAGFLLTAVPNWTGRLPIAGNGLSSPAALWLAGRIAFAASEFVIPVWRAVFSPQLAARGVIAAVTATPGFLDKTALAATILAMLIWSVAPVSMVAAVAALVAAMLTLTRMYAWKGWRTLAEPLVAILHVGYLWLPTSLFLIGASVLVPSLIPTTASLHALTAGLFGVMTLAVMTRATRGHAGRTLSADRSMAAIFVLANLGAVVRVGAGLSKDYAQFLLFAAAIFWGGAFLLFCLVYGRYLVTPRVVSN